MLLLWLTLTRNRLPMNSLLAWHPCARRAKNREGSAIDDIEEIGPKKRGELLRTFGSVRGIAAASVEDIKRVPGISGELAERIYGALR